MPGTDTGGRGAYLALAKNRGEYRALAASGSGAIPTSRAMLTRYFNEYFYHQAIESTNASRQACGEPGITKRQAIAIRDRIGGAMLGNPKLVAEMEDRGGKDPFTAAGRAEMVGGIESALAECVPGYEPDPQARKDGYDGALKHFKRVCCTPPGEDGAYKDQFVPLSPYAPDMRYRACALDSGNRIMLASADDVLGKIRSGGTEGPFPGVTAALDAGIPIYRTREGYEGTEMPPLDDPAKLGRFAVGSSYTDSDRSGASLLRTVCGEKQFARIERHMNAGGGKDADGRPIYAPHEAVEKSVELIRRLQEQGIPVELKPDMRPGQVKATIPSQIGRAGAAGSASSLDIRAVDPYNPEFMGSRAYLGGLTFRFCTDKLRRTEATGPDGRVRTDRSGRPMIRWENERYADPSVEDCLKLVEFARGSRLEGTDGAPIGRPALIPNKGKDRKDAPFVNGSYISDSSKSPRMALFKPLPNPDGTPSEYNVMIRVESDRERSRAWFPTKDDAERFLRESVERAREGFAADVDVEGLVGQHAAVAGTPAEADYQPTLSSNPSVAAVQERYWSVLTGESRDLARVQGARIGGADISDESAAEVEAALDAAEGSDAYPGTQEEKVRAHLADLTDAMVGTFEPDAGGLRFNASAVARYMGGSGVFKNTEDLIGAMQACGIEYDELRGNDFSKKSIGDRMLQFDPESAVPIDDPSLDPWIRARGETIVAALNRASCVNKAELLPRLPADRKADRRAAPLPGDVADLAMDNERIEREIKACPDPAKAAEQAKLLKAKKASDDLRMRGIRPDFWEGSEVTPAAVMVDKNGVVRYDVCRINRQNVTSSMLTPVTGYIGQLMPPGKDGVVRTNFAASDNYEFLPTVQATVAPDGYEGGKATPMPARIRCTDYDRFVDQAIESNIAQNISGPRDLIGGTACINGAVRHMQSRRYAIGELDRLPKDQADAIKATVRVQMDKDIVSGSNQDTIHDANRAFGDGVDPLDDMKPNPLVTTGFRDMMQLHEDYAGYLDLKYTGTAQAQGRHLAMADGARIAPDGRIVPVTGPDGKPVDSPSPLTRYLEDGHMCGFDMGDRENMGASAVYQGKDHAVANVAMIPCGGWTFEDQVVISKDFAERIGVQQLGDKLSDYHGNKGVTGLIVDPEMDQAEAEKRGLTEIVAWFRANDGLNGRPRLDVIQNMGSAFSRNNGGLYREAMLRGTEDLISPDGMVLRGGIGKLDIVRLEQTAEHKGSDLTVEDEDAEENLGARTMRSDGAQAGWAHIANGRRNGLADLFRKNNRAWEDAREYLNLLNIDFDETGSLRMGVEEHEGEKRPVFGTQPLEYMSNGRAAPRRMMDEFLARAEREGGWVEIPFPIKFPNAANAKDASGQPIDAGETRRIPDSERTPESLAAYPGPVYALPLLDSRLRSGSEFQDETAKHHDYTRNYMKIMNAAYDYRFKMAEADRLGAEGKLGAAKKRDIDKAMRDAQTAAQGAYDSITSDVIERKVSGKRNMFRDTLLSARRQAVTLVSLHDPRLPAGVSSMSPEAAKACGFSREQIDRNMRQDFTPGRVGSLMRRAERAPVRSVMRDPVIVHTGESAERFALDDRAPEGVGKHVISGNTAVSGAQKQKDHDGDCEAVFTCARDDGKLMGQETRMLNLASYDPETGRYGLFYEKAQDLAIGWAADPSKKDSYEALSKEINETEKARRELEASMADMDARASLGMVSQEQAEAFRTRAGQEIAASDAIRYDQLGRLSQHMVDSFANAYLDKLAGKVPPEKMPYMDFTDAGSVIRSLDNIQAIGYKGKPATLDAFARTLGVEYSRGEDGQIDWSTFKDMGKPGRSYAEMSATRDARAFQQLHTGKAGYETIVSTNAAGRDAIYGHMSGRYISVPEAMRTCEIVSHLVTQATLQVKHGLDDAKIMREMERALPLLDRGVLMEYAEGDGTGPAGWKSVKGPDGKEIQASPQQFARQLEAVYNRPKGKGGMGFSLSPEIICTLADIRTDPDNPSVVMNAQDKARTIRTPVLQRLAYKASGRTEFQELQECAKLGLNMFRPSGEIGRGPGQTPQAHQGVPMVSEWSKPFIPDAIARNIRTLEENRGLPEDERAPLAPIGRSSKGPRRLHTAATDLYVRTQGGRLEPKVSAPQAAADPAMAAARAEAPGAFVRERRLQPSERVATDIPRAPGEGVDPDEERRRQAAGIGMGE